MGLVARLDINRRQRDDLFDELIHTWDFGQVNGQNHAVIVIGGQNQCAVTDEFIPIGRMFVSDDEDACIP